MVVGTSYLNQADVLFAVENQCVGELRYPGGGADLGDVTRREMRIERMEDDDNEDDDNEEGTVVNAVVPLKAYNNAPLWEACPQIRANHASVALRGRLLPMPGDEKALRTAVFYKILHDCSLNYCLQNFERSANRSNLAFNLLLNLAA